jgi:hypothetical protein
VVLVGLAFGIFIVTLVRIIERYLPGRKKKKNER